MEPAEKREVRILLVDDHPLVRRALRDILAKEADFVGVKSDILTLDDLG